MNAPSSYLAMLTEAKRVGWPERFKDDLTKHDLAGCRKIPSDVPLFWVLRSDGTFLCEVTRDRIDGAGHYVWHAPEWFPQSFGFGAFRFYTWDGVALLEHASATRDDVRAMREYLHELAHAIAYDEPLGRRVAVQP